MEKNILQATLLKIDHRQLLLGASCLLFPQIYRPKLVHAQKALKLFQRALP
jgi:hypothetical protein